MIQRKYDGLHDQSYVRR